jgi:metallo-beta-lactamase class B
MAGTVPLPQPVRGRASATVGRVRVGGMRNETLARGHARPPIPAHTFVCAPFPTRGKGQTASTQSETALDRSRRRAFCGAVALIAGLVTSAAAPPPVPASWTTPVKPFRIVGDIYYVGTQGLGAYLIGENHDAVLIDGTLAANAPLIEQNIRSLGFRLSDVKLLLENHAHYDHVGALAQIQRDTHAPLYASAGDRWALEHGRPRGDTNYGVLKFPPVKVAGIVTDGETLGRGDVRLTAILTPGHTPGCTSFATTVVDGGRPLKVLFLCSITVAGNVLVGNREYPEIAADFARTFKRLATLKADVVLTGHPEVADVLGREARVAAGEKDAFVDPAQLGRIVRQAHEDFETAYAKERQAKSDK